MEETLAYRLRDVLPDKAEFVAVDTPAPERTWGRSQSLAIFAGFLFIALALQVWMGAFSVERGFYSDDAAHFLNGEKAGHGCTRRKFFKHGAESSMGIHPLFP